MVLDRIRVLIVDDSATVRAVLRRLLTADSDIEIIGEAVDGSEAVVQARELEPDVVLMDLDLPGLDGVAASRLIMSARPTPILVITGTRGAHTAVAAAFRATAHHIAGVFAKPEVPEDWHRLGTDLVATIRQLARRNSTAAQPPPAIRASDWVPHAKIVAIGASTGGPAAIRSVLIGLGRAPTPPVVVVQHITHGFEHGLADWLRHESGLDVAVAVEGEVLSPGRLRIAPSGHHLIVRPDRSLSLDGSTDHWKGHRPSANVLFRSLLEVEPSTVAAVLLSGMGDDGAEGLLDLRRAGAVTMVQDRASCAVFGMPRVALECGAAELEVEPEQIGRLLRKGWSVLS